MTEPNDNNSASLGSADLLPRAVQSLLPFAFRDAAAMVWATLPVEQREWLLRCPPTTAAAMLGPLSVGFDPLAAVNETPDGVLLRKVALTTPAGAVEWLWCRVESRTATTGILCNTAVNANAQAGSRVRLRLRGDGFADAVLWTGADK